MYSLQQPEGYSWQRDVNSRRFKNNPWDTLFSGDEIPDDHKHEYPLFSLILNRIKDHGCSRVLDVACGAGRHAKLLVEEGFQVTGFDLSTAALRRSQSYIPSENFTAFLADMYESFPLKKEMFDGVIAIQAIYHGHPHEVEYAMREIHRVLVPGGLFVATFSKNKLRSTLGSVDDDRIIERVGEKTYVPLVGREMGLIHYYPEQGDIETLFDKVGFSIDAIIDDEDNGYYLIIARKRLDSKG